MHTEYLEIPICPKCNTNHRYKLSVKRSMVFKMLTSSQLSESRSYGKRTFTRFFTCPIKNEEFQAKFSLRETSSDKIEYVSVIGIADDE